MPAFVPPAPRAPDGVLVMGVASAAGALAFVAPAEVGIAAALMLVSLARAGARAVALVAALAFAIGAGRGARLIERHEAKRAALFARWHGPAPCDLRGVVASSPVLRGDALRVDVDVARATCDGVEGAFRGRATIYAPAELGPLARGDHVTALAKLAPPYRFWNDGAGDPRPRAARRGVLLTGGADDVVVLRRGGGLSSWIDRARERVRRRILATFPPGASAMARALMLGETDLPETDQRAFRDSGLSHLLAVSGMHLVLVVAGIVGALRALLVRVPWIAARIDARRLACALGVPLAWVYADFAGGSGSAVRAAWMTSAALGAYALARRPDTWRALGVSVAGMALADPLVAYDLSFVLSAAATAGLLALVPPIEALLARAPPLVRKPLAATAAATAACAPVLAGMNAVLPLSGLVANLVAVPVGEAAALPLCLAHAALGGLPWAERGSAVAAAGALGLVRAVARVFAGWGAVPVPAPTHGELAAIAVLAFVASGLAGRARRALLCATALLALLALEARAHAAGAPRGVLRVTFLDVGQGDAALVDLPDGGAILVDAGGLVGSPVDTGGRVIAPVLRARRRSRLDLVVLSHPHPDHFGGLVAGLARVRVGRMWDSGQGEAEGVAGGYARALAELRARGTPVVRPGALCGSHAIGGAIVDVLAPCPGPSPDRGPNDNSIVMRVRYGQRAVLFAGDAEREEESELLATHPAELRADVLKVGHHGSRTSSSPALLAAVSPSVAVISCGVRNRFGHPHPRTLAALERAGPRVLRTDRDGAVVVATDGHGLSVRTMSDP